MKFSTRKILLIALLSTSYSFSQCLVQISSGEQHTVGVSDDGTLWGWGSNTSNEIGTGSGANEISPAQVGTATDWSKVVCGAYHTMALKTDSTMWTWGFNDRGQVGNGTTSIQTTPYQIPGKWIAIGAGTSHSLAIRADGTLWGSGRNTNYQLGINTSTNNFLSFTQIGSASNWASVSGGSDFSMAINSTGQIWGTGSNSSGQFGNGVTGSANVFTLINTPSAIVFESVDCGKNFTFAQSTSGILYAAGYNNQGQLGIGSPSTYQPAFSQLSLSGVFTNYSAGDSWGYGCTSDGFYTWGSGWSNLGSDNGTNAILPFLRSIPGNAQLVSIGLNVGCFVNDLGDVYCIGQNNRGQIGNGLTAAVTVPTQNLVVCNNCIPTSSSFGASACNTYTAPDNSVYTTSGQYTAVIPNAAGCDSTITIGLTISTSPDLGITLTGTTLTLTQSGAQYQWVDCDNNNAIVPGQSSQTFTPTVSGNYAGRVGLGTCVELTACTQVTLATNGISELSKMIKISPNPTSSNINIQLETQSDLHILSSEGKVVATLSGASNYNFDASSLENGVYFIQAENGAVQKFIKQ